MGELRHVSKVGFFTRASGIESALCAVEGELGEKRETGRYQVLSIADGSPASYDPSS